MENSLLFEVATNDALKSLLEDVKKYNDKIAELEPITASISMDDIEAVTNESWDLIEEMGDSHSDLEFTYEYLNSLLEMRVVYLFKNLEIVMKSLIRTAYEDSNTKDFYRWENMKSFFNSKKIDISLIPGYNECVEKDGMEVLAECIRIRMYLHGCVHINWMEKCENRKRNRVVDKVAKKDRFSSQ